MKIKIFCHCNCFLPGRTKDLSAPLYLCLSDAVIKCRGCIQ